MTPKMTEAHAQFMQELYPTFQGIRQHELAHEIYLHLLDLIKPQSPVRHKHTCIRHGENEWSTNRQVCLDYGFHSCRCGWRLDVDNIERGWYDPTKYSNQPSSKLPDPSSSVDHPAHYGGANNPYEAIKVIEAWGVGFCLGNTIKYISRAGRKDPKAEIEDLKKAQWYLQRRIEQLTNTLSHDRPVP